MTCDICGKKRMIVNKVSHSNIKSKSRQNPNVQRVRVVVDGTAKRLHVCSRCIRSGKITKVA
ncbi:MAG: 50S ribosomal protein L28 [Deltaproteobacteria bacterium]|nr:50S ribosomal protein L28 [Deltaproteobacteria bacterium]